MSHSPFLDGIGLALQPNSGQQAWWEARQVAVRVQKTREQLRYHEAAPLLAVVAHAPRYNDMAERWHQCRSQPALLQAARPAWTARCPGQSMVQVRETPERAQRGGVAARIAPRAVQTRWGRGGHPHCDTAGEIHACIST